MKGVDKGRAARNLATLSTLLARFEYLHYVTVLNRNFWTETFRDFSRVFPILKRRGH